jgi:hypothetical protein
MTSKEKISTENRANNFELEDLMLNLYEFFDNALKLSVKYGSQIKSTSSINITLLSLLLVLLKLFVVVASAVFLLL